MKSLHNAVTALGAVFLSLGVPQVAQAQLRTPIIDGVSSLTEYGNEYEASNPSDSNRESLWRVTWDDEYLYVAVEKAILTESAIIYIDSDPQSTVNAGGGALRGFDYDATNGKLPFRADAAVFANRNTRQYSVFQRERNEWGPQNDYTQTPGFYADKGFIDEEQPEKKQPGEYYVREFKVRWADISVTGKRPENFNWVGHNGYGIDGPFIGDEECNLPGRTCKNPNIRGGIYGQVPRENPFGEREGDFTWSYYFTVLNSSTGSDNSAFGPSLGLATSRASYPQLFSYTHLSGDAANFGGFRAYDFTLNAPGVTITRTGPNGTVEWNILGNLVVGANSTLNFDPSIAPLNLSGDIIIDPSGSFSFQNAAGRFRVGGDILFSTPTSFRTSAEVILTGNGDQTISGGNYRALIAEGGSVKTITSNLTVTESLILSSGTLATGSNTVRLVPGARLTETSSGYLLGRVSTATVAPITASNPSSDFGGIGLTLTRGGNDEPGSVNVLRITGGRGLLQGGVNPNTNVTIARRFLIDNGSTNNSGTSVTLTFNYRDSNPNELNGNLEVQNRLKLYESANLSDPTVGPYQLVTGNVSNIVNADANTLTFIGQLRLNRFFSLSSDNAPLPVELISFTGKAEGNNVRLNWATASELQNKGFEIEHRTDLSEWKNIGFVVGNGTTSQRHLYTYLDRLAVAGGNNYYRLRQIDLDGKAVYSQPVTVKLGGNGPVAFSVSPVPTTDVLTLNGLSAGKHVAEIYNARGQRVMRQEFSDSAPATLSVRALPVGVYMVRVLGANRSTQNARFIKQ
ncbi:hypothetical protein SAMN00120144_0583 [Hymenobacter roseosalivarius DSM 11622]|uniref:Secretion system C-terminal sorting domain-containing protein n=1 Tax=Hymenobacter roseosalivarius DSM 11622 TaxID=645990 RepID=A0A1W1VC09_9BACT|nr:T9SS type A sorting domain-containing protein [Hymenobacter roseosalivarius]SMB90855.1 hypothetical protein SAMN00120144_0583 [Hymenobacter roseosalivarius DSM 11622]